MEMAWSDIGARVREARAARGLDQSQLGAALGLERSIIAKIETGARRLSAVELLTASEVLDVPMGWIVRQPEARVVSRRAAHGDDPRHRGAGFDMDLALEEWAEDVLQLTSLGALPVGSTPTLTAASVDEARLAARQLRRALKLGDEPIAAVADVAAQCGLWLWAADVPDGGASVILGPKLGAAVISSLSDPGRRRFTAAHELGHQMLADAYSVGPGVSSGTGQREAMIDAFAQELLIPSGTVMRAMQKGGTAIQRQELTALAVRYRVSWSVVARIAKSASPRWRDEGTPTRAEILTAVGRMPDPDLEAGTTAIAWQQAVLDTLRTGAITRARALEMLRGDWRLEDLDRAEPRVSGDEPM